jgi:hypothetical protein
MKRQRLYPEARLSKEMSGKTDPLICIAGTDCDVLGAGIDSDHRQWTILPAKWRKPVQYIRTV